MMAGLLGMVRAWLIAALVLCPVHAFAQIGPGVSMVPLPIRGSSVTPGTMTCTIGSSCATSFVVPPYNTLQIEIYGGGASAVSVNPGVTFSNGNAGGTSSIASPSLSVLGGTPSVGAAYNAGGAGAVAPTGFDVNTAGNPGLNGTTSPTGFGGNGPAPLNAAGGNPGTTAGAGCPGVAGLAPGAGGGGPWNNGGATQNGGGAGSGAYGKKTYTFGVTAGFPAVGATLALTIGPGGALSVTGPCFGGRGADGRMIFTWS